MDHLSLVSLDGRRSSVASAETKNPGAGTGMMANSRQISSKSGAKVNPANPKTVGGHFSDHSSGLVSSTLMTYNNTSFPAQARAPSSRMVNNNSINNNTNQHNYSSAVLRTSMVRSTLGFDRSRNFRNQVERAVRDHKIFSCVGVYPAVRKALHKRGWVEKNPSLGIAKSTNLANISKELEARAFDDESDQAWINRVLRDYPPDFIWVLRRDNIDWRTLQKDQIINRFPKATFTTKVGIAACLQSIQWFSESGLSDTFFPRCYRLCIDEEKQAFIDDYRLTACTSLMSWLVTAYENEGEYGVMDKNSRVVSLCVDFAVRQVTNYVRQRRHEDLDWLMPPAVMGQMWDVFMSQYYNVVCLRSKLAPSNSQDNVKLKYDACKRALARISGLLPQLNIDGVNNMWICKPGAKSRGKGIVIMNQLDKILDLLSQNSSKEANWVVQKYIERPMLVYKTKFDIRQWFVVTDWQPLTIWFYKESYIRFCTKPFSLDDFHESLHLCNNAIQCRYQNAESRDPGLPEENMWDDYTFQAYLKAQGDGDLWNTVIYPGMKQGILGVMLASQETTDVRKNCFELYGADFMLGEDGRPWLIEINSCPCMASTTVVTTRMCAQCLEDVIKVVLDRKDDKNADTGLFELIYKQTMSGNPVQSFNGSELVIQGKKLNKDLDWSSNIDHNSGRRGGKPQAPNSLAHGPVTFTGLKERLIRAQENSLDNPSDNKPTASLLLTRDDISSANDEKDSTKGSLRSLSRSTTRSNTRSEFKQKDGERPTEEEVDKEATAMAAAEHSVWKLKVNASGQKPESDNSSDRNSKGQRRQIRDNGGQNTGQEGKQIGGKSEKVRELTSSSPKPKPNKSTSRMETSLSVLLMNSNNNRPTVADLARLTGSRLKNSGSTLPKTKSSTKSIHLEEDKDETRITSSAGQRKGQGQGQGQSQNSDRPSSPNPSERRYKALSKLGSHPSRSSSRRSRSRNIDQSRGSKTSISGNRMTDQNLSKSANSGTSTTSTTARRSSSRTSTSSKRR